MVPVSQPLDGRNLIRAVEVITQHAECAVHVEQARCELLHERLHRPALILLCCLHTQDARALSVTLNLCLSP